MADTKAESSVVVGFDGSESAGKALEWAARQAELTGAAIEVVTSWEWPVSFGWAVPFPAEFDPAGDAQKVLDSASKQLAAEHPGLRVTVSAIEGHPALALVDASRHADLLVVGSRGHGEFAGMLLGSVSEHCATNAHCPVLIFR